MQELLDAMAKLIVRLETELGPLPPEYLDRRPATGGWTARETIGHLIVTVRLYNERLAALLAHAPARSVHATGPHRPNWVARLLLGLLRKEGAAMTSAKAPRVFRPDRSDPDYTAATLVAIHKELHALATSVAERGLSGRKIATPVNRLLRIKARDAVEAQLLHGRRHLEQALRTAR